MKDVLKVGWRFIRKVVIPVLKRRALKIVGSYVKGLLIQLALALAIVVAIVVFMLLILK